MDPSTNSKSINADFSALPSSKARAVSFRQHLLLLMLLGDVACAYLGLYIGYLLRFKTPLSTFGITLSDRNSFIDYQPVILLGVCFLLGAFLQQKIYNWKLLLRPRSLIPLTIKAITFWFFLYLCTSVVLKFEPQISRIFMACSWIAVLTTVITWKYLFTRILRTSGYAKQLSQKVVFAGWTNESADLADAIYGDETHPYIITGWVETGKDLSARTAPLIYPRLGKLEQLESIIKKERPDLLVVADLNLERSALTQIAKLCEINYVQLKILPSMFQIFLSGLRLESVSGKPLLGIDEMRIQRLTSQILKRSLDIVGSLFGLIISAPALLILAFLIKREDPSGPIFYRQTRSGHKGAPFTIYKLRSMRTDAEKNGAQWAQANDPRRLKIGAFMRETNLDELPQFWNVLKGDMSLVGPRPERPELIENFEKEIEYYNHRHQVKPGITGWAQINGLRGDTDLSERIRHDVYYIENWSIWMDFYCLVMTFIKRDNAY